MDDHQLQLGAFLRSLDREEHVRFNGMIARKNSTGPHEESNLTWEKWKANDIVGIVASKQNNPVFWNTMVCRSFPKSSEGQDLLRHILSMSDKELWKFSRTVNPNPGVVVHINAQRDELANGILDCEHGNRSRWDHALRHAGIAKLEQEPKPEQVSQPPVATELDDNERADLESLLKLNTEARSVVEEINESVKRLETEESSRRNRAWRYRYTSLLSEEYWARMVMRERKKIRDRDIWIVVVGLVFAAILTEVSGGLAGLLTVIVTILVKILFHRTQPAVLATGGSNKKAWAELAHDLNELWFECEQNYWNASVDQSITRYSERIRAIHASELEAQDNDLVDECQRVINRRLEMEKTGNAQQSDSDTSATTEAARSAD